jgi:replicative DNA helicase
MPDRPPSDVDSEQACLGSLLIDSTAIVEIADFLTKDDFYRPTHGQVYAAMVELYEGRQPIDVVTVAAALESHGDLETVGGASYLSTLANDTPTSINVGQYAHIVQGKAVLRRLIGAAGRVAAIGYEDGSDIQDAVDRAQAEIFAACDTHLRKGFTHVRPLMHATYDRLEEIRLNKGQLLGIPSGLPDLDEFTLGFQPSDLIVIAARPGSGKTAISLQIAAHAAQEDRVVGFFSLEMSKEQLGMRLAANAARVRGEDLRSGWATPEDFSRVLNAMNGLADRGLYFDDTPAISVLELRTRARRLSMEHGLNLIVVDYLQLMKPSARSKDSSREQDVSAVADGLKALAKELNVPIIAAAQLNRRTESSETGEPRLSDLRESGAIEQSADLVLLLWREKDQDPMADGEIINANLAKHRNGPVGYMKFMFKKAQTRFEQVADWKGQ